MVNETLPRASQDWTKQIGSHSSGLDEVRSGDMEISKVMSRIEGMLSKMLAEKHLREIDDSFRKGNSSPPPTPDPPDSVRTRQISAHHQLINRDWQIYPGNQAPRYEFPKFNGTLIRDWIWQCEQLFFLNRTPPELMVRQASLHFEGKALQWHNDYIRNRYGLYPSWPEYMIAISNQFGRERDVDVIDHNCWVGSTDVIDSNVQRIDDLKEYGVVYNPMVIDDNQMVAKATPGRVAHQVLDEMSAQSESNEIMVNAHLNEVLELDVSQVNKDVKRDEMDEFSSVDELYSTVHKSSCKVVEISKQIAQKQEVEEIDQVEIMSTLIVSEMRSDLAAQQVISKMSVSVEISKVPKFNVLLNHGEEIKKDEMNEAPSVARKHLNTVASQPFDERSKLIEKGTELSAATSKDIVLAEDTVSPNMEQAILSFDPGGAMKLLVFNLGIIDEGGTKELNAVLHPVRLIEKKSHGHIGAATSFDPGGAIAAHRAGYRMNGIDEPRVQDPAMGYKTHRGKEEHILSLETSFVNQPAYFALKEPKFALGSLLHSASVGELTPSAYFEKFAFDHGGEVYAACCPRLSTSLPLNSTILDSRGLLNKCKEGASSFAFDPGGASMIFDDNNPFGYLSLFDSIRLLENSQDMAECVELLMFDPGAGLLMGKTLWLPNATTDVIAPYFVANLKGDREHIEDPCTAELYLHALGVVWTWAIDATPFVSDSGGRLLVIKARLFPTVIADFTTPHLIANFKGDGDYIAAHITGHGLVELLHMPQLQLLQILILNGLILIPEDNIEVWRLHSSCEVLLTQRR